MRANAREKFSAGKDLPCLRCCRNIDRVVDVHVLGKVVDAASAPVSDVGVFVWQHGRIPRDGTAQALPFIGESSKDGSLDLKFRFTWGSRQGRFLSKEGRSAGFSLHFVHDDFDIEALPMSVASNTGALRSTQTIILTRLTEAEVQKRINRDIGSKYLRKRDPEPGDLGESWDGSTPRPHEAAFGGDTFSISGNCSDQRQKIVDGVRWAYWQLRDGKIVSDPGLRVCIMQHMNNASLGCSGGGCDPDVNGYNDDFLIFRSSYIVLCLNKVRNLSVTDVGRLAIHEWAHSCGWDHGDGKGVPGDSGVGLG